MNTYRTFERPDPRLRHPFVEQLKVPYDEMLAQERGGLVYVAGETGSGRTVTVRHFVEALRTQRALIIDVEFRSLGEGATESPAPDIVALASALFPLIGTVASPTVASVLNAAGALLQGSQAAYELGQTIARNRREDGNRLDPEVLVKLLRRAAEDQPVVCLLHHIDEAESSWWDTLIRFFEDELFQRPVLFVTTLQGGSQPIAGTVKIEEEPAILLNAHELVHDGVARWIYLPPRTREEIEHWIGRAEPQLAQRMAETTGGNPLAMKELWEEWWRYRLIEADDYFVWQFVREPAPGETGAVSDMLTRRLKHLLPDLSRHRQAMRLLRLAAMEGRTFTPQALATVLGQEEDELFDLLDKLLLEPEQPHGFLEELKPLTVFDPKRSREREQILYQYRFTAHLFWLKLAGDFVDQEQRQTRALDLAQALAVLFEPEQRVVASRLSRLYAFAGHAEQARRYRTMSEYAAERQVLYAQAQMFISVSRAGWGEVEYLQAARVLIEAGEAMLFTHPYAETLRLFQAAEAAAQRTAARGLRASALYYQGWIFESLGRYNEAEPRLREALNIFQAVGDRRGEASTLSNIGGIYANLGEKQKALQFFEQALPLLHAVGHRSGEAATLNNIGSVYSDLDEKQKALQFYEQALPLLLAVGDHGGEAATLNNIGLVYSDLDEKQKALHFYEQALLLDRAVGDRGGEATTLNNIGLVYDALGEKQQALQFFKQALPLRRTVGDRWGESSTRFNMGAVYAELGDLVAAEEQVAQTVALDEAIGHPDLESHRQALAQVRAAIKAQRPL